MGKGSGLDKNLRYVRDKRIALLLNEMVVHLLGQRPKDPLVSLIDFLESKEGAATSSRKEPDHSGEERREGDKPKPQEGAKEEGKEKKEEKKPEPVPEGEGSRPPTAVVPAKEEKLEEFTPAPVAAAQPARPTQWSEKKEPRELNSRQHAVKNFPVGAEVVLVGVSDDLDGKRGHVVNHNRGRVGVQMYDFTPPMGLLPGQLRLVELGCQKFTVGCFVEAISGSGEHEGKRGKVVGLNRDRVGVEFEDGTSAGLPLQLLRKAPAAEMQQFPIGMEVQVVDAVLAELNGKTGTVMGHSRGRVGVRMADGTMEGLPPSTLKPVGRTAPQTFTVGSRVVVKNHEQADLNGASGVVRSNARGRLGVELDDGRVVGLPPSQLLPEPDLPSHKFQPQTEVVVVSDTPLNGMSGRVTAYSRGRVGVVLSDGSHHGFLPEHLKVVPLTPSTFPVGTEVTILNHPFPGLVGQTGRVLSTSRGRVGVQLGDGKVVGVPPEMLKKEGMSAKQAFHAGEEVEILAGEKKGATGRVVGCARGRVGVELVDGTVGVPPEHLRKVGKMTQQAFAINTEVVIIGKELEHCGKLGFVRSVARGRVAVELLDGTTIGCPVSCVAAADRKSHQAYPIGSEVVLSCEDATLNGLHGWVVSHKRGRVGVDLDDGRTVGVPYQQLKPVPCDSKRKFPKGTEVMLVSEDKNLNGRVGRVTGTGRSRVGVTLENGEVVGVPQEQVKKVGKMAQQEFAKWEEVVLVCDDPKLNGKSGKVMGTRRGRVGVELDSGETVGVPKEQLRHLGKSERQAFPVGTEVDVQCPDLGISGKQGRVIGYKRGRVGVELRTGEVIGVPKECVHKIPPPVARKFVFGEEVEVIGGEVEVG
eukprot:Sspe_Gene.58995::Locus_32402_Transcript_1_1_Confidence_1.000_Length_2658::g.58995::m.58995